MTQTFGDLRRALRPGDADPGARRARPRAGRAAQRRRVFRAELDELRDDATPAGRRRSRSPSASRPTSGSTSSARISSTPARTSSTTRSARPCSRGGSASSASSPRPAPASTASRPRRSARASASSASSTWAPRTCAARRRTSSGCACSAPRCGRRVRDEDAEGGDERGDPRLDHERRDDPLPDRLVRRPGAVSRSSSRELQRVIGDEAREQILAAEGRLPDAVVACVGGGSNAIGIFYGLPRRRGRAPRRRRGRGRGEPRRGPHGRAPRRPLVGARRRRRPDRRRALDLRRPRLSRASAPSTPPSATRAAPSTCRRDRRGGARRLPRSPRPRGSSRRSRARTRSPARSTSTPSCPRLPLGPRRQGPRRSPARTRLGSPTERSHVTDLLLAISRDEVETPCWIVCRRRSGRAIRRLVTRVACSTSSSGWRSSESPIAEINRRVGAEAERLGFARPSYERVRELVHVARDLQRNYVSAVRDPPRGRDLQRSPRAYQKLATLPPRPRLRDQVGK